MDLFPKIVSAIIAWPDLLADWLHPPKPKAYFKPYEIKRYTDGYGNWWQKVAAVNHREATNHLQGITIEGDRSRTCTRIEKHVYLIGAKEWNVNTDYDRMSDEDKQAYYDFIYAEAQKIKSE